MGDGVVQVAGQPLPFQQLDLVELAHPRPGPVPQRRAQGDGRRTHGEPADRVGEADAAEDHREADACRA